MSKRCNCMYPLSDGEGRCLGCGTPAESAFENVLARRLMPDIHMIPGIGWDARFKELVGEIRRTQAEYPHLAALPQLVAALKAALTALEACHVAMHLDAACAPGCWLHVELTQARAALKAAGVQD